MRAPKPLIIIDTNIIGGPGRGLLQLLPVLKEKSIKYLLCTFRYRHSEQGEFAEELQRLGSNNTFVRQRFRFDPTALWDLFSLIRRKGYNIIQSHGYKSHVAALIISRVTAIPWVAFAHGSTNENLKVRLYHRLDDMVLRFADIVVAVSPKLRAHFGTLRGVHRPTRLIFNAVDVQAIRGSDDAHVRKNLCGAQESIFLIGCFGRLSREKGQDVLLHAFSKVSESQTSARLLFVGDGPDLISLKRLSRQLGIVDKVSFHRHSSFMRDYYQAIDLLVLPSRSEGLPNVVLEAMAFAVPVIASDVGAVSEVLTNGKNGWIVPSGDEAALAERLVEAIGNERARKEIARAGQVSLAGNFCSRTRASKILEVYEYVLSTPQFGEQPLWTK